MWIDRERLVLTAVAALSFAVSVTCAGSGRLHAPKPPTPRGFGCAPSDASAEREPSASAGEPLPVVEAPPAPEPEALSLPRFYAALAELEAGKRQDHVRILWLGDSHTHADYLTGAVRRALSERFGAGGPGYLRVGLGSYRHGAAKATRDGPLAHRADAAGAPCSPRRRRVRARQACARSPTPARAQRSQPREGSLARSGALAGALRRRRNAKLKVKVGSQQELLSAASPGPSVAGS